MAASATAQVHRSPETLRDIDNALLTIGRDEFDKLGTEL
jgi:hypothetical protein